MKIKTKTSIIAICLLMLTGVAAAKTIRATEINLALWSELNQGKLDDLIVEFRQGDLLPISISSEGDLIETTQSAASYVRVKRDFWLKVTQNKIQMSLDGTTYKDIHELLSGSLTAGANSDQNNGIANAINIAFKAYLK